MVSIDDIRRVVRAHKATHIPAESIMKQAAVAAVVRARREAEVEVLFIRRAEHPKDPWSGHMAFPGGRVDADDLDARSAAMRETREELALDLGVHATYVGELSHLVAVAHGKPLPMIILPYVFELRGEPVLALNDEVQEALWVPLAFLLERTNRSTMEWSIAGATINLPCYRYEGRVIWGLTLKMLDELLGLVDPGRAR